MTVMGDARMDRLSDAGSIPARSIRIGQRKLSCPIDAMRPAYGRAVRCFVPVEWLAVQERRPSFGSIAQQGKYLTDRCFPIFFRDKSGG